MLFLAESFWQQLVTSLMTPSLQMFLLIGSAVLAIALLILTLTRLGHARPVMKCVILSVIAHVLLLGYAYGTKLIFEYPTVAEPAPLNVQVMPYDEDLVQIKRDEQPVDSQHEIDNFVNDMIAPEVSRLQRPAMDSQLVIEPALQLDVGNEIHATREALQVEPVNTQDFQFNGPELNTSDINPNSFNELRPVEAIESSVQPQQIEYDRRGENSAPALQEMPNDFPADLQNELDRVEIPSAEIQRPTPTETDSAFVDDQQRAEQFESELVVPEAPHAVTEQALPRSSDNLDSVVEKKGSQQSGEKVAQPTPVEAQPQKKSFSKPRHRIGDGQPIPKLYSLRNEQNRKQVARQRGGSDETEQAVAAALQWLADNQKSDGRWDPRETGGGVEQQVLGHNRNGSGADADTGITALATLAFLGAGNTHLEGQHRVVVQKALEFLVRSQQANGNLAGEARLFARMYCHSMALLALSEALAVTGDQRLTGAVDAGVKYSTQAQNPTDGGWRYQPGDRGDMSQFGWQVLALHSAAIGGVKIDQRMVEQMHRFLDLCTSGKNKGLASYRPGQGTSTTMTAEALVCRFFMDGSAADGTVDEATDRIVRESPSVSGKNFYYWYYATMAMYHSGGEAWTKWNQDLKRTLLPMQVKGGTDHGSWKPDGMWSGYGGRVYSTAMATLSLEVYYRYLPIYEVAYAPGRRR